MVPTMAPSVANNFHIITTGVFECKPNNNNQYTRASEACHSQESIFYLFSKTYHLNFLW